MARGRHARPRRAESIALVVVVVALCVGVVAGFALWRASRSSERAVATRGLDSVPQAAASPVPVSPAASRTPTAEVSPSSAGQVRRSGRARGARASSSGGVLGEALPGQAPEGRAEPQARGGLDPRRRTGRGHREGAGDPAGTRRPRHVLRGRSPRFEAQDVGAGDGCAGARGGQPHLDASRAGRGERIRAGQAVRPHSEARRRPDRSRAAFRADEGRHLHRGDDGEPEVARDRARTLEHPLQRRRAEPVGRPDRQERDERRHVGIDHPASRDQSQHGASRCRRSSRSSSARGFTRSRCRSSSPTTLAPPSSANRRSRLLSAPGTHAASARLSVCRHRRRKDALPSCATSFRTCSTPTPS